MGIIKHSQITQTSKLAISLQHLKKEVKNVGRFDMQINIKVYTSWYYPFWWK